MNGFRLDAFKMSIHVVDDNLDAAPVFETEDDSVSVFGDIAEHFADAGGQAGALHRPPLLGSEGGLGGSGIQ